MLACYSCPVHRILAIALVIGSSSPVPGGGPLTAAERMIGSSPVPRDGPLTAADGRELEAALARILLNAGTPSRGRERRVVISERAVNGFLRFQGADRLPPGLTAPELEMEAGGRLTVTVTVDLDAVREQQSPGRFNPLRFLSGRLPVTATGVVRSARRRVTIDIESTHVGSLSVPATLVNELVRIYTRSDEYPDGIDLGEPIALPSGIDAVLVEPQRIVIVQ